MTPLEESLISPQASLSDALQTIETATSKIALVVDDRRLLLGTVTDGDIRRGILRGASLDSAVTGIMNRNPVTAKVGEDKESLYALMQRGGYRSIPLIDGQGRVAEIEFLDHLLEPETHDNWVVIMAGGFGRRLLPLTETAAKPMLQVGDRPVLETIVRNFSAHNFRRFLISVHHRANDIVGHFGDGSALGVEIEYLHEETPLGTAGALRQLPARPDEPFIVMNGDILTKVNFVQLLDFHKEHNAIATLCVHDHDLQVPYGVVSIDGHRFKGIKEKPILRYFVNAGIYVLSPSALDHLPQEGRLDMPDLLQVLQEEKGDVSVFPIREYWLDIGRHADLERAHDDFDEHFSG